jgi:hypothetical protein
MYTKEWKPAIEECDEWYGIYCYDYARTEFSYDTAGNVTERIQYTWDPELGSYVGYERYILEFDENGNRISYSDFRWDTIGNDWILAYQSLSLFDSAGNEIGYIGQEFDITTGDTVSGWRHLSLYDSLGNQIQSTSSHWDADSNGWVKDSREKYSYDSLGNQVQRIYYNWDTDSNEWELFIIADLRYDSLGYKIEETYCAYWDRNDDKEVCDFSFREAYVYDVYGNLTERIFYEKFFPAGDFIPDWSSEYFYDSAGNLIEETESRWELGSWQIYSHCVSIFDSAGNIIERSCQEQEYYTNEAYGFKTAWFRSYDLIWDQVISAEESCQDCSVLAPIITGSKYEDEPLSMDLTSGDDHNLFKLDTVGGDFVLVQDSLLDYEIIPVHHLTIEARLEDSTGTCTDSATLTVYVRNINDNAPVIKDTTIDIREDIQQTENLITLSATDADGDLDTLTFSIISGNESNIFKCDARGIISLVHYDSIDYERKGTYILTVEVTDGLFRDDAVLTIKVIDVDETYTSNIDATNQLKFYPNPVHTVLYLEVPTFLSDGFETAIMDLSGRVVFTESGYLDRINLSTLPHGVYFITIRSDGFISTQKIIKLQ